MTPSAILIEARAAGVTLWVEGGTLRYRGDKVAVESLLPMLKAHKPELLEALQNADAEAAEDLRDHCKERAGILEQDAGLSRAEAELEAARITATYARNCGYQWASLRLAFEPYPVILAALPDKDGPVDMLPLGVASFAVVGRRVMRQGAFTGAQMIPSPSVHGATGESGINSHQEQCYMKISECFSSKYLKASDLNGRQVKVQIESVAMEKMADNGDEKPVVYFAGKDKGLVLNRTNATLLFESFGDETDKWKGLAIALSTHRVNFQGRMVDGITVRVPAPIPVTEFVEADIPF